MTREEAVRYAAMSPRARPGAVAAEINMILQILGTRFQYFDAFVGKTQGHLSRITEAQSTMLRIRDTPVPLPYLIILVGDLSVIIAFALVFRRVGFGGFGGWLAVCCGVGWC